MLLGKPQLCFGLKRKLKPYAGFCPRSPTVERHGIRRSRLSSQPSPRERRGRGRRRSAKQKKEKEKRQRKRRRSKTTTAGSARCANTERALTRSPTNEATWLRPNLNTLFL